MATLFNKKYLSIAIAALVIGGTVLMLAKTLHQGEPDWITTTVERGDVTEIVSVSGYIEAKNTADLAFPTAGVVTDVFVDEGTVVKTGEVLATQAAAQLVAQRNEAVAALQGSSAQHTELLAGPSDAERTVTAQNVLNAQQNLDRVIAVEEEKVNNARKTLLSSGLTAVSNDANESAAAPTISGTYACTDEGSYTLSLYRSGAFSGYSYELTGLETGTASVYTQQESPLGSCGLYIQFVAGGQYSNSKWTIAIPNTLSATYITNKNAFDLAIQTKANNIKAAEDALQLAREQANLANAAPRTEKVTQAQAAIRQAQAKIAAIDAQIADRSIVAPFDGIITDVNVLSGETATNAPVITILAEDAFELKARVPEIDITKIKTGQHVTTVFDAQSTETLTGEIAYISPLATEIDGVAYFETTIVLDARPEWIRSGLNADIDIIVQKSENVLRIPKRFLIQNEDGSYNVQKPNGQKTTTLQVGVPFIGNDGYAEITGLSESDSVVAP